MFSSPVFSDLFTGLSSLAKSLDSISAGIAKIGATTAERADIDSRLSERSRALDENFSRLRDGFNGLNTVMQPFVGSVKMASDRLIQLAKTQFTASIQAETEDIQAIGQIQSAVKNKLSFTESFELFRKTKQDLAEAAAVLPFSTADYVMTFKQSIDSVAQGITESKKDISKGDLASEIQLKGVEVSKLLTLQAKTTNTSSIMAAKVFGQFLGGQLNLQADFFQANAVFKDKVIDEAVKLGAKKNREGVDLSGLDVSKRYQAFVNALRASISPEMLEELENSLSGAFEGLRSLAQDNTSGILGFNRRFKSIGTDAQTGKEIDTFFGSLSAVIRPVIQSLSGILSSLLKLFDPLQIAGKYILGKFQSWSTSIRNFGAVFSQTIDDSLAKGLTQIEALQKSISLALLNAFGIQLKPIEITPDNLLPMFHDWLVSVVRSLAEILRIDQSRQALKTVMTFTITEVLIPYVKLLGEVVLEVLKKDILSGLIVGAVLFAPLFSAIGSIVTILVSTASLLKMFFGTALVTKLLSWIGGSAAWFYIRLYAGILIGSLKGLIIAVAPAIATGLIWAGVLGLMVVAGWKVIQCFQQLVDLWAYRPTWLGGKGDSTNLSGDEKVIKDGVMTREQLEAAPSYRRRKELEEQQKRVTDLKQSENVTPLKNSVSTSATTNNQDMSKNTEIVNYFTVNSTQDAETIARQIMASFSGSLAGLTT